MNRSKIIWIWIPVLIIITIGGYFLFKYFYVSNPVNLQNPGKENLSKEERFMILQNLVQNSSTSIPISQKNKIINTLQKQNISTLSDSEKMNILNSLQVR